MTTATCVILKRCVAFPVPSPLPFSPGASGEVFLPTAAEAPILVTLWDVGLPLLGMAFLGELRLQYGRAGRARTCMHVQCTGPGRWPWS